MGRDSFALITRQSVQWVWGRMETRKDSESQQVIITLAPWWLIIMKEAWLIQTAISLLPTTNYRYRPKVNACTSLVLGFTVCGTGVLTSDSLQGLVILEGERECESVLWTVSALNTQGEAYTGDVADHKYGDYDRHSLSSVPLWTSQSLCHCSDWWKRLWSVQKSNYQGLTLALLLPSWNYPELRGPEFMDT